MSAACFGWPATGRVESLGCFPTQPGLLERGRLDGCGSSYQLMQQRGELCQFGKNLTDVSAFLEEIRTRLEGQEVLALLTDRYRRAEMLEAAQKARLRWPVIWRGTGAGPARGWLFRCEVPGPPGRKRLHPTSAELTGRASFKRLAKFGKMQPEIRR